MKHPQYLCWVSIKLNVTDQSAAKVDSINIPNVGNIGSAALHYWYDSSYSYYEYIVGTGQLGDCPGVIAS